MFLNLKSWMVINLTILLVVDRLDDITLLHFFSIN